MKNIPPVIRQFFCTRFSKTTGALLASGLLIAMPAAVQAVDFVGGPITFNDAPSVPYPSTLLVSGLGASLSNITLTLTNYQRSGRPDDIDMLLVGPTGVTLIVFSDCGGNGGATGTLTITLSDAGATYLPDAGPLASGTFKPTNESLQEGTGDIPGAPPGPYGNPGGPVAGIGSSTFATQFNSTNPNGTWSLYINDDTQGSGGETGSILNWTLHITAVPEPSTWVLVIIGAGALIVFCRRQRAR